jgi:hypothetical protein
MKPDVLLIEPMMAEIEAKLDLAYTMHRLFESKDPEGFLRDVGARIRGVATGGGSGVAPAIMDALPSLEIIAINGIGTDAVDLAKAKARGIRVTTTPNVLTDDVADLGFALLLATARSLCVGDRFVRAGSWSGSKALPLGTKVSGKRLGIFGMGRIGREIAARAQGFKMSIAYTDLRRMEDLPYDFFESAESMAANVDSSCLRRAGRSPTARSARTCSMPSDLKASWSILLEAASLMSLLWCQLLLRGGSAEPGLTSLRMSPTYQRHYSCSIMSSYSHIARARPSTLASRWAILCSPTSPLISPDEN